MVFYEHGTTQSTEGWTSLSEDEQTFVGYDSLTVDTSVLAYRHGDDALGLVLGALDDVYDPSSCALPGGAQRGSRFSAKASVPSRSSG